MKNKIENKYIIMLIFVISGIFGFIYETLFYKINLGYFVKRGSTFGPWIPIYGIGGVLITLLIYKYKNSPIKVFLLGTIICGIVEYITGYFIYNYLHTRLWDYNTEIWNYLNIDGYICLRSVLFFGISGLFLVYCIIPFIEKIYKKYNKKIFKYTSITLSSLFIIDFIIHTIIK